LKDALGSVQTVLVLGGASEIGTAIAGRLGETGRATVLLAGRDDASLRESAARVARAGARRVETMYFDALDTSSHDDVVSRAVEVAGGDLDVVVLAFGLLGEQGTDQAGGDGAVRVATTNYVGAVSAGLAVARRMRSQGHGTLVALSSVAGRRVRKANFIYGSSKAGMDGFFQGLSDDLVGTGAGVLIVRPGFVRSKMTAGLPDAPFPTTPEAVADATVRALASGRRTVWIPAQLQPAFALLQLLPSSIWRRIPG
jgi:decaprenylphospho-beta-D-erythro-pentofuranosid-2-ulose 2-reductase